MGTMGRFWDSRVQQCLATRFDIKPKLALVGRHDAGRDNEMSPIVASSQLARKDK